MHKRFVNKKANSKYQSFYILFGGIQIGIITLKKTYKYLVNLKMYLLDDRVILLIIIYPRDTLVFEHQWRDK